jgi:hypothetical protein
MLWPAEPLGRLRSVPRLRQACPVDSCRRPNRAGGWPSCASVRRRRHPGSQERERRVVSWPRSGLALQQRDWDGGGRRSSSGTQIAYEPPCRASLQRSAAGRTLQPPRARPPADASMPGAMAQQPAVRHRTLSGEQRPRAMRHRLAVQMWTRAAASRED